MQRHLQKFGREVFYRDLFLLWEQNKPGEPHIRSKPTKDAQTLTNEQTKKNCIIYLRRHTEFLEAKNERVRKVNKQ